MGSPEGASEETTGKPGPGVVARQPRADDGQAGPQDTAGGQLGPRGGVHPVSFFLKRKGEELKRRNMRFIETLQPFCFARGVSCSSRVCCQDSLLEVALPLAVPAGSTERPLAGHTLGFAIRACD